MFMFKFFFFKQKTAVEMRISDWSSDVCSSVLDRLARGEQQGLGRVARQPRKSRQRAGHLPSAVSQRLFAGRRLCPEILEPSLQPGQQRLVFLRRLRCLDHVVAQAGNLVLQVLRLPRQRRFARAALLELALHLIELACVLAPRLAEWERDRKSTRLNSSH